MEEENDFKNRLKELREEEGLSPEQLSERINDENEHLLKIEKKEQRNISANAIRKYEKGYYPKNIEFVKRLAKHFNVSVQYLLGQTSERTTNINIQEISKRYGLSEKALKNLEFLNNQFNNFNEDLESIGLSITHIKTINKLIEEFTPENHNNALLSLIDFYLNLKIKDNLEINISTDGDINIIDSNQHSYGGIARINNEAIIGGILNFIDSKLIDMRKMKEDEINECKRTRKK